LPADLQDHDEIEEALYLLCSRYVEMVSLHSLHSLRYDGESQLGKPDVSDCNCNGGNSNGDALQL